MLPRQLVEQLGGGSGYPTSPHPLAPLERITTQVVELLEVGELAEEDLVVSVDQRQRVTVVDVEMEEMAIGSPRPPAAQELYPAGAVEGVWYIHFDGEEVEDRRQHVEQVQGTDGRTAPDGAGRVEDQRHVRHFAVEAVSVPHPAVVGELLAVIRGHDGEMILVEAEALQARHELADRRVDEPDLPVVELRSDVHFLFATAVEGERVELVDLQRGACGDLGLERRSVPCHGGS